MSKTQKEGPGMFLQEFSRHYGLVKVKSLCTYSLYIVVFAKVPVGDGPGKVHNALLDRFWS